MLFLAIFFPIVRSTAEFSSLPKIDLWQLLVRLPILILALTFGDDVSATAPGTILLNQAQAEFKTQGNAALETLTSNQVVAHVQALRRMTLSKGRVAKAHPGATIQFSHVLSNTGNTELDVQFNIPSITNQNFDSLKWNLWIDQNGNGIIDNQDKELRKDENLRLLVGQIRTILLNIEVPKSSQEQESLAIPLSAYSQDIILNETNQILVANKTDVALNIQTPLASTETHSSFSLNFATEFEGTATIYGREISVDGTLRKMVTVSMPLPAGVYFAELANPPPGFEPLYRLAGSGPDTYSTKAPENLRSITELAFAIPALEPKDSPSFTFPLTVVGESREIRLFARMRHAQSETKSIDAKILVESIPENSTDPTNTDDTNGLRISDTAIPAQTNVSLPSSEITAMTFVCFACDSGLDTNDSITVEIVSQNTLDQEIVELDESQEDRGEFSFANLRIEQQNESSPIAGDKVVNFTKNDWLHLTFDLRNGTTIKQSILVDPAGAVFDSVTGTRMTNAEVTLYSFSDNGIENLAVVFSDAAKQIPANNPTTTNQDGLYEFPFVEPGNYILKVTRAPRGFNNSSNRSGEDMEGIADQFENLQGINEYGQTAYGGAVSKASGASYGDPFIIEQHAVNVDIPIDPLYLEQGTPEGDRGLELSLALNSNSAAIGDLISASATIENLSGNQLPDVTLQLNLPLGLQLVPETISTHQPAELENSSSGQINLDLGSISAEATTSVDFQIAVTPAVLGGNAILTANVNGVGLPQPEREPPHYGSRTHRLKLKLLRGVFNERAAIIGRVFNDCNGDGVQENAQLKESGVENVRVYLQNGRYADTDKYGRFTFAGLRPSRYVIKLDSANSIRPIALTRQNFQSHNQQQMIHADLMAGELFSASFPLARCTSKDEDIDKGATIIEKTSSDHLKLGIEPSLAKKPDNDLDIVEIVTPQKHLHVLDQQSTVEISGAMDVTFVLQVNGKSIDESRLGSQTIDKERQRQSLIYYAVPLSPGSNVITAQALDRWGNIRGQHSIEITSPGPLDTLKWDDFTNELSADGSEHSIDLLLLDKHGKASSGSKLVTIELVHESGVDVVIVNKDIDATAAGIQLLAVDGKASVKIQAPQNAGTVTLQARTDNLQEIMKLHYTPKLRQWIVAGAVESQYDRYLKTQGELAPTAEHNYFGKRNEHLDFTSEGGNSKLSFRGSIFAKGSVDDRYLVTLIADTDKQENEDWSGKIDQQLDYPIYGDDAETGAEGDATKGLYLRVEHDDSYLLIGDLRPHQDKRRTQLGAYSRKFYGLQHQLSDRRWLVNNFVAQASTNHVVDFIRARGISGPFTTSKKHIIPKSEKVEIVTRTRAEDGRVVGVEKLIPNIDYDFDPVLGTLLLRAPISGYDSQGRPRFLRITYNVDDDNSDNVHVFGSNVSIFLNEKFTIGALGFLELEKHQENNLYSVNAMYKISDKTKLITELANSERMGATVDDNGNAARLSLTHQRENRHIHLQAHQASKNFKNISSGITAGTRTTEFMWREKLPHSTTLSASAQEFRNNNTEQESRQMELDASKKINNEFTLGLALINSETKLKPSAGFDTTFNETSVGLSARYTPSAWKSMSLEAKTAQSIDDSRNRYRLNADYQLPRQGSILFRWEKSQGYNQDGDVINSSEDLTRWSLGYKQQIHSSTQLYSQYLLEDANDGYENSAATGLRFGYDLNNGLRLTAQAEKTHNFGDRDESSSPKSWAIGLSNKNSDSSTWLARLEMLDIQDQRWLQELRYARRINARWSFLTKQRTRWRNNFSDASSLLSIGLAHRPTETKQWDWLGSLTYDDNDLDSRQDASRPIHISLRSAVNYRPSVDWTISASAVAQHRRIRNSFDYKSTSYLARWRMRHDISEKWNVGVLATYFNQQRFKSGRKSWGLEAQRKLGSSFFIGLRYQKFGYRDGAIDSDSIYRRGFSLNFGGVFDENTLQGLLSRFERDS